jgi:eukaryotic-like serine/threonine-protein kinase
MWRRGGLASMSDTNPPLRGLVAGKYELVRLIGRGGMGTVWEGRHATLATRVAIKFVDPQYADSAEARARFVTEARAAATIRSKYAIQIYDHGLTDDGRPYIVMELLAGEPLDRRLERLGRLPLRETARLLGHVCRALQRAHDAGIIHRDLKPENIFLVSSPDDDEEIAKVLDFGIAKFKGLPGGPAVTSSTKTGAVLGTPFYMSPEQARGLRQIDHRTDLWSLGVIAYKCVTGILPFDGESVGDLLVKICTAPLPVPSRTTPGLAAAFDRWFARALEREPDRRFGSASELADALAASAGITGTGARVHPSEAHPIDAVAPEESASSDAYEVSSAGIGTSAPFIAPSTAPTRTTRARWLGIVLSGVLGGTVGVLAVVKVVSTAPSTPQRVVDSPIPVPPASPAPLTSVGPTAPPTTAAAPVRPNPPSPAASLATVRASRPPSGAVVVKPVASASTTPTASARPAPALAPSFPVPPTSKPTTADPGY